MIGLVLPLNYVYVVLSWFWMVKNYELQLIFLTSYLSVMVKKCFKLVHAQWCL